MSLIGLTCVVVAPTQSLAADDCPVIDYSSLYLDKAPAANWKNGSAVRVITWSSNEVSIETDAVSVQFSASEQAWLQEAFDSYGEILDSVAFQKITTPNTANIVIGYTLLSKGIIPTETTGGNFGIWKFTAALQKALVQLLDPKLRPKRMNSSDTRTTFIGEVQNEIANVLGMPDVNSRTQKRSLVTIYDTNQLAVYGQTKINDYDAAIMRQLYGESTCNSLYSTAARAANLAADKIAGEKLYPSPVTTTLTTISATPAKKTSISCVKGKTVKKVTAIKPVCPTGYKKK
jgi:hypothetical protein